MRRQLPTVHDLAPLMQFRKPTLDARKRRLESALTIWDLRDIAARRTPRAAFDYTEGAAEAEISLARARQAFEDIEFTPAILRDVSAVDTTRSVLGAPVARPFGIAPTGFTRMMQTEGERAGARAAGRAGIPFSLSTMGTTAIEDVRDANPRGRNWFQLYMWKDRDKSMALVDPGGEGGVRHAAGDGRRARGGARLRDKRNGFSIPPQLGVKTIVNAIPRPWWWFDFLTTEPLAFASLDRWSGTVGELLDHMFDPTVTYEDLAWIRDQWPGKVVVKGVQSLADAKRLASMGVDGITLSNHGGRQLDRAPVPFHLLPSVVREVGADTEVHLDTGIMSRRGTSSPRSRSGPASRWSAGPTCTADGGRRSRSGPDDPDPVRADRADDAAARGGLAGRARTGPRDAAAAARADPPVARRRGLALRREGCAGSRAPGGWGYGVAHGRAAVRRRGPAGRPVRPDAAQRGGVPRGGRGRRRDRVPWLTEPGGTLLVNGVDVVPLVDAELDRRFPGRALRRATDPAGLRAAWDAVQRSWDATLTRANQMPPGSVDESVAGEWSFAETLRHLVTATDVWLRGAVLGVEQPYHPLGRPHTEYATDGHDTSVFSPGTPAFDDVLAARADRVAMVTAFLGHVTPEQLDEPRANPWAPEHTETVRACLHTVLEEEWEHHRYAVRDLDVLDDRRGGSSGVDPRTGIR